MTTHCNIFFFHCSILAWRIPWMEEPGGLQSMGLKRVRHDWATNTHTRVDCTIWTWQLPALLENACEQASHVGPDSHQTQSLETNVQTSVLSVCVCDYMSLGSPCWQNPRPSQRWQRLPAHFSIRLDSSVLGVLGNQLLPWISYVPLHSGSGLWLSAHCKWFYRCKSLFIYIFGLVKIIHLFI